MTGKRADTKIPKTVPGAWQAELLRAGSVQLGGATNQSPSSHAIEFSYLTLPALARGPNKIGLPAVIVVMALAEDVVHSYPGSR